MLGFALCLRHSALSQDKSVSQSWLVRIDSIRIVCVEGKDKLVLIVLLTPS